MPDRDFGGIKVSAVTAAELVHRLRQALDQRSPISVTFLNPDYARRAFRSEPLRRDINRFDLVLVDGIGVQLLAPLFGFRVPARLDTDSVSPLVFELLAEGRGRVFLFGSAPGVAARAAERLSGAYPGLVLVGSEHGYHDVLAGHPGRISPADSDRIVTAINASRADLVVVGLPTPLQQGWLARHRQRISAPVVMTGGSYLDHMAENDRWPATWYPTWADRLWLNWFYRLLREPRRLWRRYSIEFADYLRLAIQARRYQRSPGSLATSPVGTSREPG